MSHPYDPSAKVFIVEDPQLIGNRWLPEIGEETFELLDNMERKGLPQSELERVRQEASDILSRCVNPRIIDDHTSTGLVVGYVQSGKTLSFTMLTALARDNNFQLVIVIAGTSINLLQQSTDRLREDLQVGRARRSWYHVANEQIGPALVTKLKPVLSAWRSDSLASDHCRTILITVMKNHRHLEKLAGVLSAINLTGVPTLIIDDEGDQASLNTLIKSGDESTTYRRILDIRQLLSHHTYLQYTATPQAPLLISIIDTLSPNFCGILTPGIGYVGGKQYFTEQNQLVRIIPSDEIPTKDQHIHGIPGSLYDALKVFLVGVAAAFCINKFPEGNRSMLVHPSRKQIDHRAYFTWINTVFSQWRTVAENKQSRDWQDLVNDFRTAYDDLSKTVQELPEYSLIVEQLPRVLHDTQVHEVNSARGKTPSIDMGQFYSFILVGGQAMDRGFTVKGLTVTYMPRGTGVNNADTIQQRARFFGYKADYLDYCRVYLETDVADAMAAYVNHEEAMRDHLIDHEASGKPLAEWKRAFFLSSNLKPTRHNVLNLDYMRGNYAKSWFHPKYPHYATAVKVANNALIDNWIVQRDWKERITDARNTRDQIHSITSPASIEEAFRNLLVPYRMSHPTDSKNFTGLMLQLSDYVEKNPNAPCHIFRMSRGALRVRRLGTRNSSSQDDPISQLFQGANKPTGYGGDKTIAVPDSVTIQIHNLDLRYSEASVEPTGIRVLAIWLPSSASADWIVQDSL